MLASRRVLGDMIKPNARARSKRWSEGRWNRSSGRRSRTSIARSRRSSRSRLASPLVFSSPHSGSTYPERFLAASRLDPLTLRRSEDAFVDELFLPCVALGAPLLRALFPRAYLDVNREPYELDPQIFDGRLPEFANTRSLRVAVGLGTIPRVVGDAQPIYRKPIPVAEGLGRIETLYRPYHDATESPDRARARMVRGGGAARLPLDALNAADVSGLDIVLGDRYGASAAPAVVDDPGIEPQARGLSGPPQQAVRRRLHHRAFRRARRRRPCGSNRDRAGALSRRAQDRPDRTVDRAARRSVRGGEGAGAANSAAIRSRPPGGGMTGGRKADADVAPQRDRARRTNREGGEPRQKRRPPCCHGGLQSREETPKEGICGRSCRTATISSLTAAACKSFLHPIGGRPLNSGHCGIPVDRIERSQLRNSLD